MKENDRQLQERVLRQAGLRIEPHMAQFLAERLVLSGTCQVIGGDARTGIPRRQMIHATTLAAETPTQTSSHSPGRSHGAGRI